MAYVSKQLPEDEQNQFALQTPTTPNPAPQSGGSVGEEGGGNAAPGQASSTQFGSNAAKLSDYLKANEPQVQQFGNEVAGKLNQGYQDTVGAVDQGFGNFNQQVNQGYVPPDQGLIDQAASNPVGFASDPNNVSKFQSLYNNQYQGPQNFEGSDQYAGVNDKVNKAVENASLVGNFGGLSTYLDQFGGANKTQGMKTLDTALLQRSQGARDTIQQAAKPYQGLNDYLGGKVSSANQSVQQAKDIANQSRQDTQNRFVGENGVLPSFQAGINQRKDAQSQQATSELNAMNKLKAGEVLTDDEYQLLGLTKAQMDSLRGKAQKLSQIPEVLTPWGEYFNQTPNPASVSSSSAATPEEYAQSEALAQLTGQQPFLNPSEANLSGSVPLDTNFNFGKADSDLDDLIRRFVIKQPTGGGVVGGGFGAS